MTKWFVTANQEDIVKTTAILATLLAFALSACAAEEDYSGDVGPRPAGKPSLDPLTPPGIDGAPAGDDFDNRIEISETLSPGTPATFEPKPGFDDGRLEWAVVDGNEVHVHLYDPALGSEEITTYNDAGEVTVVEIRDYVREQIKTNGFK